jgi:hypothetical protein
MIKLKDILNEANLKKGDKLTFKATSDIWIVQRPHGDGYYVKERGMPQLSWQPKDWLDNMIKAGKVVVEGKINEAQANFSTDAYKIADSFTSSELKKLKEDGKISVEVYNGATEIQRIWKKNHPTMKIGNGAYRKEILRQLK